MKNVHVVFQKSAKEVITSFFEREVNYNVINYDEDITTFRHYMLKEDLIEKADIALLVIFESVEVPIEVQIKEIIKNAIEVKLAHVDLRLVFAFPQKFEYYTKLVKDLVSVGIYDIHFINDFKLADIVQWLDNEKTLSDVKKYITTEDDEPLTMVNPGKVETESNQISNNPIKDLQNDKESGSSLKRGKIKASESPAIKEIVVTKTIEQKNIAILSFNKCAGATFHTTNLASYLANSGVKVGVYEYPKTSPNKTYLTDVFDFFSEYDEEIKRSIPHLIINNQELNIQENVYDKGELSFYPVNYMEGEIEDFTIPQFMKYLNVGRQVFKIMDFGNFTKDEMNDDQFYNMLSMFDVLIVVLDMMPVSLLPNFERLSALQKVTESLIDLNTVYIINHHTDSIKKEHYKHLNIGTPERCPSFDRDKIFKAMYDKQTIYDYDPTIRNELNNLYNTVFKKCNIELKDQTLKRSKAKKKFNLLGII